MKFEFINNKSNFLNDVIDLGTKNSKTLGFLPEGGFREHAKKRWIITAHEKNQLVGYLLFRIVKKNEKISITHLCVKDQFRGKRISTQLINCLKNKFKYTHNAIILNCREDYIHASKLWENYGFIPRGRKRSRSETEHYLITWSYHLNKLDLFNSSPKESSKIKVVLDANILIKLRDNRLTEFEEVKALMADWLIDDVEYHYAQEMYNEIHRDKDKTRTKETKIFLQNFVELKEDKNICKKIENDLKSIFPGNSLNDISDRKQLAEFIASDKKYFITYDKEILKERTSVEDLFNVKIMEPIELILEIDQLLHSDEYSPVRLEDARHESKRVTSSQLDKLINKFLLKSKHEKRHEFKQAIRDLIQADSKSEIKTIVSLENEELALWGCIISDNKITIPIIRTIVSNLAFTLFCQIIREIIEISVKKNLQIIEISDSLLPNNLEEALENFGFILKADRWVKITLQGTINTNELFEKFPIVKDYYSINLNNQNFDDKITKTRILYDLERKLYPLKFQDLDIPCYIIPIKPYWASQLFDNYSSIQLLFGAESQKIWNRENVYYRHIKPINEKYPARILWYVSTDKGYERQKSIVACSYLDDVIVDKVKSQFRAFKRFGIYNWGNVYDLAGNDINNEIKALRFSDTEVFRNVITFPKISSIFLSNDRKRNTFASPVEIEKEIFFKIYELK